MSRQRGGSGRIRHDHAGEAEGSRETNPALSTRRLKLGTFQTNLDSGCVMSELDGRLDITWPNTVALAKLADEMEFEALVPVARWQGWGGKTNPQGPGFEAYTWAAGISARDAKGRRGLDLAHHHQPSDHRGQAIGRDRPHLQRPLHPQHRHRLGAAGDRDVRPADALPRGALRLRRGMARDRQAAVDRGRSFDHEGRFFKIKKGYLAPKPIQYPYPAIMNAGASELGRHYAVKNCDLVFTVIRTGGLDECRAHVAGLSHSSPARQYNRDIKVWTLVNIVQGETEKEARDFYNYYVHQKGDWEAAKNMVEIFSLGDQQAQRPARAHQADAGGLHPGLGRLAGGRHQRAGGRYAGDAVEGRRSTACWWRFRATRKA